MNAQDQDDINGVETLLRAAGRRAVPPAALTAAVYQQTRLVWRGQVRRRKWVRRSLAVAASLMLMFVAVRGVVGQIPGMAVATVDKGQYTLVRRSYWHALTAPASGYLFKGDTLLGGAAGVLLRGFDGAELRLDRDSRLIMASATAVQLQEGRLFVQSNTSRARALRVQTDFGTVEHLGTQFLVSKQSGALQVAVRDGRVALRYAAHESIELQGGQAAKVDPKGHLGRWELPALDNSWDWADVLAGPLRIDGLSLHTVVAQIAQRSGLTLSYADAAAAAEAQRMMLHGQPLVLPLRSALAAILVTTSLSGTVEGRQIVVAAR